MGNFNRDNRGGGRSFGKRSFGGNRQMFDATCANCGKSCQVPFRPTGDKPVYCSECFEKMGGRNDSRRNDNRSFDRPRFDDRKPSFDQNKSQFDALNAKLDKITALLEVMNTPKVKKTAKKPASEKKK